MAIINTGIVERTIVGVHDANFVHPLGDELISNGGFSTDSDWTKGTGWSISGGTANCSGTTANILSNIPITPSTGKQGKLRFEITNYVSGQIALSLSGTGGSDTGVFTPVNGFYEFDLFGVMQPTSTFITIYSIAFIGSIDNVSLKEVLVNRESTATNTGIVERPITGVNESEIWLDESTSVVNNTGIVERPITGVNESDPMFPDNTISNIVNIAGIISSLIADLKARATTFENEDATRNILINLQNC